MNNSIFKIAKWLIISFGIIIFFFGSFLIIIHLSDYRPAQEKQLLIVNPNQKTIENQTAFSILSWNLGYCGLGKEMDFFYDGGKQVRASKILVQSYLKQNLEFIQSLDNIDFMFFQEVDKASKRSYFIDQSKKIDDILPLYNAVFACNYRVPFVPMPILNPMGKVNAGIMTYSRFLPSETFRYAYPNIAPWPDKLFLLDRCFILSRLPLPTGKELVLINTHNSYYISEDSLRMIELDILKNKMLQEYEKGNYVIVGGDWNKYPPCFYEKSGISADLLQANVHRLEESFLPADWAYAFDPNAPSNRELIAPYVKGETKLSVIDFFIVSPNINIENCYAFSLGFEGSDHNPVKLDFTLVEY